MRLIENENNYPKSIDFFTVQEDQNFFVTLNQTVINNFFNLVETLEKNTCIVMCTRGDSRVNNNIFFDVEYMKKFFVVGQKADVFQMTVPKNHNVNHIQEERKTEVLEKVLFLARKVNHIIESKKKNHNISGQISPTAIEQIKKLDLSKLNFLKIIFISFLHNNGDKSFKSDSPFLSLTNGEKKFDKAKEFALSRQHNKGYIFLYALNKNLFSSDYIITEEFTDFIRKLGIQWYPDIHQEIMLLNGMYPHFILGIYKIENCQIESFFMNPELYKLLSTGHNNFDTENGLPINQKNFIQLAKELGHRTFFFIHRSKTFISDLNSNHINATIKVQLG